ncbi:MAG TPA: biosynthetic peptidoglycan transglycosylase [Chloroflexota bacterium]|jgi:penicillin-binding protein 1A|nr:biosynthetic peptidoglycan transglycosylase [Chloroflexota bacterium]
MIIAVCLAGLTVLGVIALVIWFEQLPSVADLPTRVQSNLEQHHAAYTPLSEVPPDLQAALIVTEDERFYQNQGIDLIGLGRAIFDDLQAGRPIEGGSTLTEQLAKMVYVGNDNTIGRKLETLGLALKIAHAYSKDEVLTLYLNQVYLGHGAYGVGQASEVYFQQPVRRLDLAECALLAGLPQAPAAYDPLRHPDLAERRQAEVLQRMVDDGVISSAQAAEAQQTLQRILAREA